MDINMKLIPLTQGLFAQVDDEDFEKINQFNWTATKREHTFYAFRDIWKNKKNNRLYMHTFILGSKEVDHKDLNGLNNKRLNLRACTRSQNRMNSRKIKNTTSKYKGVSWDKDRKKWFVHIGYNYRNIVLGRYKTENEAALIYNQAALKYFGEFARLNVIEE